MRVVNCVPVVRTGSVTVMARDIGHALRSLGADVRDMDYKPGQNIPGDFPELMTWLSEGPPESLLVDINGAIVTSRPARPFLLAQESKYNCFTFLTDAPLHFPTRFENWPTGGIVGLVDHTFRDLALFMKFQRPEFVFFPHAGPRIPKWVASTADRDIDVLIIGNVAAIEPVEAHTMKLYPDQPRLAALFVNGFHRYDPSKTPFQVVRETAMAMKSGYRRKDVALTAVHLESYVNHAARAATLSQLKGLKVTLAGNVADGALASDFDIHALDFVPFDACLALMARARVVVNIRPGFPNGAHERIFYALSRGAAVLTTQASYLDTDRSAHEFIEFFDVESGNVREKLIGLLDRIDKDAIDRDEMLRHYSAHHTWKQRLEPILTHPRQGFA
jgi:hypothetical protein